MIEKTSCIVCGSESTVESTHRILSDIAANLFHCSMCDCRFFDKPSWLERAYLNPISENDFGIVQRNIDIANVLSPVVGQYVTETRIGVDFGGGLGLLSRILRDRGFNFYSIDPKLKPVFPIPEMPIKGVGCITMIEVLEHLPDPLNTLKDVFKMTDVVFISTHLTPRPCPPTNWWYFQEDSGQHIFFPSETTLGFFADCLNANYCSDGKSWHILSRSAISWKTRFLVRRPKVSWTIGAILGWSQRNRALK